MENEDRPSALRVLTAGATREGLAACAVPFRARTGIAVDAATTHGHLILERLLAGETGPDVVLLPEAMVAELEGAGLVRAGDSAVLGSIGIGAAVRAGEELPEVSSMTELVRTLFSATAILITEAPSGVHMDRLMDGLGLADILEPRIERFDTGTMVNERLLAGSEPGEIAFGVATELLFFRDRGIAYAGPLPDEAQMRHVYRAAVLAGSARTAASRALLDYLVTKEARAAFAATGVDQGEDEG
jgi:molybdate transport system substrate-binding protein